VLQEILVSALTELQFAYLTAALCKHDVLLRITSRSLPRFVETGKQFTAVFDLTIGCSFKFGRHDADTGLFLSRNQVIIFGSCDLYPVSFDWTPVQLACTMDLMLKSVSIAGHRIPIKVKDLDECYGQYVPDSKVIEIDKQTLKDKRVLRETLRHENGTVAESFVEEIVEPLVQRHQPDLVWIDPVFQYLGGDANQQEVVGRFLRQNIGPLLKRHDCAMVLVHHTAKPSKATQRNANPLLRAYDAAGSAEFSNWPRAVLSLQSTNAADTYRLVAAKRGGRLGWRMPDGTTRCYEKMLTHSREPGTIFWQEAVVTGVAANNGQTATATVPANSTDAVVDAVLANVPPDGIDKKILIKQVNQLTGFGVNLVRTTITALVGDQLREYPVQRKPLKSACYVQRVAPQPAAP